MSAAASTALDRLVRTAAHDKYLIDEAARFALIKRGFDPDAPSRAVGGWTALERCCRDGDLTLCEWLVKHGADKDVTKADSTGNSLLSWAFMCRHLAVCQWLIANGALNVTATSGSPSGTDSTSRPRVNPVVVHRDLRRPAWARGDDTVGPALLAWARGVCEAHEAFRTGFLPGTLRYFRSTAGSAPTGSHAAGESGAVTMSTSASSATVSASSATASASEVTDMAQAAAVVPTCLLWKLRGHSGQYLRLVAQFAGVVLDGRVARNCRELLAFL